MSNYTKSTNFATKDNLTPGDPLKIVQTGYETTINGTQLSIQKIEIQSKNGKIS